ncbi:aldehyde dehydrogenase family protein [Cytobacillus kochii]|uniref:aldehyde dehydrogenase family protein n=1 Tax=Cytobacillus kochii TaxID=859143 RepID=UPI00204176EB|nr:aldehyde dehydrogenase family protein [Cytobacillus kochii]MCM3321572.1 aldehyde dehydrogenase family protein [Cytobacillus kochii]MCM3343594.1 aldehyde dehydrogenase family protein [Cytobacillus kochii]MDM5207425.1 aldehyde dehydrogenase family protein [Cytobacillus kochii]
MISTYPKVSGKFLIDGKWLEAENKKEVINPANTQEVVGEVALCTKEHVDKAITSAVTAFESWSQSDIHERAEKMKLAAGAIEKIVEENVNLLVRENGKILIEAKKDLLRCVDIMREASDELLTWWQPESLDGKQKVQIRRRPRGVTAVISPWNSPMILTFKRVIPAILTGNTVIVKPATSCPLTIMTFLEKVASYFPNGVLNVVTGSGSIIGDALCKDSRVRTVAFVGSTETGKEIMKASASNVKNIFMELGGNDAAIILEDAKLDDELITKLRFGILRAAGQVCSAVKRVYVHESRYEELVEKLRKKFQYIRVGSGIQPDVEMGPLNNQSQYEYVKGLISRAKDGGAEVLTGGIKIDPEGWNDGYFIEPTIITGVNQNSEIVQAEQFGPVIPILSFQTNEEALKLANDSHFGLRASVWTENEKKAIAFADQLEAGAVFINNHTVFQDLHLDFPGLKESGISRETRHCSLEFFADTYGFAN